MSIATDDLITSLREHIGVEEDDADWTNDKCLLLLNRSYWELNNKFNFREKEGSANLPTVDGQVGYDITAIAQFEAIQSVYVLNSTSNLTTKLARTTVEDLENRYNLNDYAKGFPVQYYRRNVNLYVFPTPDDVYTLTIKYLTSLVDLSEGTTNELPREWHEVILYGALWRAQTLIGDMERSNATLNYQVRLMDSIVPVDNKEENDSRESGVSVYTGYGARYNNGQPVRRLWR